MQRKLEMGRHPSWVAGIPKLYKPQKQCFKRAKNVYGSTR